MTLYRVITLDNIKQSNLLEGRVGYSARNFWLAFDFK